MLNLKLLCDVGYRNGFVSFHFGRILVLLQSLNIFCVSMVKEGTGELQARGSVRFVRIFAPFAILLFL